MVYILAAVHALTTSILLLIDFKFGRVGEYRSIYMDGNTNTNLCSCCKLKRFQFKDASFPPYYLFSFDVTNHLTTCTIPLESRRDQYGKI